MRCETNRQSGPIGPDGLFVQKKTWRDSLPIDMLLSAVSVLVVAQSSSEIPEELMNNPVYPNTCTSLNSSYTEVCFRQEL